MKIFLVLASEKRKNWTPYLDLNLNSGLCDKTWKEWEKGGEEDDPYRQINQSFNQSIYQSKSRPIVRYDIQKMA